MALFDNYMKKNWLAEVQQRGYALKYVREQTPEICLVAAKWNRKMLHFIEDSAMRKQVEEALEIKWQNC